MRRRDFLGWAVLGSAGLARTAWPAAGGDDLPPRSPHAFAHSFDFAGLKGQARVLASQPYRRADDQRHEAIKKLDWDQYQAIRFRPDHALWAQEKSRFRLQFFHLGLFYQAPVRLHEVRDGQARELAYDRAMFDYGNSGLRSSTFKSDLGFAGFRLHFHSDWDHDVAVFLGASYFRAVGAEMQFGLSARGLAIDCGMDRPEEFPLFTTFWFERPAPDADRLTVYALLDSPSVTGAYRFDITPGGTLQMDVDSALYPRRPIERLGIAPLTSMFQTGENDERMARDWRPEIHDSDGLALWTGHGERIWRPLQNPAQLRFNAYADENPRGFGLLQRDRLFDHYQDDGVFYERRPSLWVEPRSPWGRGSVHLVELPTPDETNDNIVAYWNPEEKPQPGQELLFSYRLSWGTRLPNVSPLASVVATRTGIGGVIGQRRNYFSWRFVVDFAGGALAMISKTTRIEAAITSSRGVIEIPSVRPLDAVQGYRAIFDLRPDDELPEPINLRLVLRLDGKPLSETWQYQWSPPSLAERAASM